MSSPVIGIGVFNAAAAGIRGRVGAVFDHAVHLHAGELVLTLGCLSTGVHPYTLTVSDLPETLRPGQAFSMTRTSLRIGPRFRLDFDGMRVFRPRRHAAFSAPPGEIASAVALCRDHAAAVACRGGFHCLLNRMYRPDFALASILPTIERVSDAMGRGQWRQFCHEASKLSGVGPGLTPSGDDFLAGMVSTLRFFKKTTGNGPGEKLLDTLVRKAAAGTSPFSGCLLRAAGKGWVSKCADDWLHALFTADLPALLHAQEELLQMGHSSGVDMLSGMIIAVTFAIGGPTMNTVNG